MSNVIDGAVKNNIKRVLDTNSIIVNWCDKFGAFTIVDVDGGFKKYYLSNDVNVLENLRTHVSVIKYEGGGGFYLVPTKFFI